MLSLLVLAFLLSQLWLLLRAVSHDAPFTDQVVRRLRVMGLTLILWELLEPFLWLFLSPKAWDYSFLVAGDQGVACSWDRWNRAARSSRGCLRRPATAAGGSLQARCASAERPEVHGLMAIDIRLDHVLLDHRMTLTELQGVAIRQDARPGHLLRAHP
ncbi:DUF2975 domain-containing protein [Nocardioides sp. JQ2195]|nr:DUF2975 domain-containing protein [Nocardioides sp. JQ2195]